jgi:hypothetical protein
MRFYYTCVGIGIVIRVERNECQVGVALGTRWYLKSYVVFTYVTVITVARNTGSPACGSSSPGSLDQVPF